MQSSISASSRESCPGVRWNIISTDGDPKVQLPRLWMLTAWSVIWRLALRCRRLISVMSL